ncbi:MAG: 1-deoxy-D-xylulose-5-phosphate reductoisomerase [bacterium]|nr:1-deoxy-D-xylulose-5-phosphate reductoisomerase [bacterium]MDD5756875.1 1-deoxy-D-xylulose-5-phosphate reductoisomerase [bacterium]
MKKIVILGSTGSIGVSTLEVAAANRNRFRIIGLTGNNNLDLLEKQIQRFRPEVVVVSTAEAAARLKKKYRQKIRILHGPAGLLSAATWPGVDLVVSSLVGALGLEPTLAAIAKGRDIALANKEVLVMAGPFVMAEASRCKVKILPIDSEHSALWQCLKNESAKNVSRLILTASGGPFWQLSRQELFFVDVNRTLAHPTWNMGRKVTVDSATLMNKGFEVIEAHHLFGIELSKIHIVIHPESIVHSMVEFTDGSVIAQLAIPDMKLPIQYALCYPDRPANDLPKLDLARIGKLTFTKPDFTRFPCLKYAFQAAKIGGTMPAVMSAADEIAVQSFLENKIGFIQISKIIDNVMKKHKSIAQPTLSRVIKAADWARTEAKKYIKKLG